MKNNIHNFAFFGTSRFSVILLDNLKKKFDIAPSLIVTLPDMPKGRKQILSAPETKVWGEPNGIKVFQPEKLKSSEVVDMLRAFDFFIVASYGKIIPESVLNIPKYGALNVHPSLLPLYRGASPIQAQILHGEKNIGTTIMLMDKEMDHGPILSQKPVSFDDPFIGTFEDTEERMAQESAELLAVTLPEWLNGGIAPRKQDDDKATFTSMIEKEAGEIKLSDRAEDNYRKYLAYHHWPKVFYFEEKDGIKKRTIITDAIFENGQFKIRKIIPEGKKERSY